MKPTTLNIPRSSGKATAAAIAEAAPLARKWRENNSAGEAQHRVYSGVVVVFESSVSGWMNELRNPESWEPGCIAVDINGNCHIATGGNAYDGATEWTPATSNQKSLADLMQAPANNVVSALIANATRCDELAAQARTLAETTPPQVGDMWEAQGGWYAGIIRNPDNNEQWHLILPECPGIITPWGTYGTRIPGEFSDNDGLINTNLILNADPENVAALYCANHNANGNIDCYWPAQAEQNLLRANLRDKMESRTHWCSTSVDTFAAWIQFFESADHVVDNKAALYSITPVRRVMIRGAA